VRRTATYIKAYIRKETNIIRRGVACKNGTCVKFLSNSKTGKVKKYQVMEQFKFESLPPSASVAFEHKDRRGLKHSTRNFIRLISGEEKMTLQPLPRTAKVVSARFTGNERNGRSAAYLKMNEKRNIRILWVCCGWYLAQWSLQRTPL
jgi:hypothetical protein